MTSSARSSLSTVMLQIVLVTAVGAQTLAPSAVGCAERHSGTPTPPWSDNGDGSWVGSCQGDEDCDRVLRAHHCTQHGRCATPQPSNWNFMNAEEQATWNAAHPKEGTIVLPSIAAIHGPLRSQGTSSSLEEQAAPVDVPESGPDV